MTRQMYLAGLLATWDARDAKYLHRTERGKPLTRVEVEAVLVWRRHEAMRLEQPERGLALATLREWKP